jgi:hypothetical protein
MRRNTYTGVLGVTAQCHDCGWYTEALNGLANAARHADAHPDHEVSVEQTIGVTYNRKDPGPPRLEPESSASGLR